MSRSHPKLPTTWQDVPVVVTGASGFLGSRLAERLAALGARVAAWRSPRSRSGGEPWPPYRWRDVDLLDGASVHAAMAQAKPLAVFHLGGIVNLQRSPEVARACLSVNILGTQHVLEALRETPVACAVYTSTTEIYGGNPPPFHEGQVPHPPSPYAVSKLAGEHLCRLAWQVDGTPAAAARLTATYGPNQAPHRLVAAAIRAALTGEPLTVYHAAQERDWLYVDDAVEGLLALARCERAAGEVANFGSTARISQRALVERIGQLAAGSPIQARFHDEPQRIGEAPIWATDASRAKAWCGWAPRVSMDEGLRQTIAWHRARLRQPVPVV